MGKLISTRDTPDSNQTSSTRRFGSERQVSALTGFSTRTLQKDRLLNRKRFPHFKICGKVLYDLDEILRIIEGKRQGVAA
jgi:hypothetical protein